MPYRGDVRAFLVPAIVALHSPAAWTEISACAFFDIVLLKRHRPGDIRGVRREAVYGEQRPL